LNDRPKIDGRCVSALRQGLASSAASGAIPEPSTNSNRLARSTLQAVEYLIKQNDPARLRAFLAKHTGAERLAIKRQLQRNNT
jgi:hypothetical protein